MNKYILTIALLATTLLPLTVIGGQSFITQYALKQSYKDKIETIDNKIDILEKRIASSNTSRKKTTVGTRIASDSMGANINVSKYKEEIKKLEEKRLILEVAYELVNDSFTVK